MSEKITFDKKNYRKHSDTNKKKIKKSLQECGAGRSVLVDKDGCLIAGNGVYEQAEKLGIKTRIVETDGSELVVVKRTDLTTDDEKRKLLALADNATSDKVEWDFDTIGEDFEAEDLAEWGLKLPTITETEKLSELSFTDMYYKPTNKPNLKLKDCLNLDKFTAKRKFVEDSNLSDELKEVLYYFTYRFIKIDFEAVANYYAFCATDEEREVIERLRMVLVDGGINGFIEDDLIKLHGIAIENYDE